MYFPELNNKLTADALIFFLKTEFARSGFNKAVLGLSGGLDSALVATLAAKALGPENVYGLLLPYQSSAKNSIDDAMKVVEKTGINHHLLEITDAVHALEKNCMVDPEKSKKGRLGNMMARLRMITIFDFSFKEGAVVLGTSNKSEIALGYATLFGDIASAINPIGDLYKTWIFELSRYLEIPESVINKAPSADLWEGQTDEGEIGFAYRELDPVLYQLIEKRRKKEELYEKGFNKELVDFAASRLMKMHFKRKIPIIAKITPRTFGTDFLYAKDIFT